MSEKISLNVEPRSVNGRKVKSLRRQGIIPANVFGKKVKSFPVQVDAKIFAKMYESAGETSLIYLNLPDKKQHPVLITNLQKHPVTGDILHIDFRQVVLTEKVTAMIPLEITGESPAVKDKNGVLVQAVNEIEVEALPTDFPDNFTLDVSSLAEIGDSLLFKDLKYDKSKLTISLEPDDTLVTIKPQEEEVVEETPAPVEGEVTETPAESSEGESKTPEPSKKESEPEPKDQPDTQEK